MKPFYQGKIDVFCALYAVLNGLKITHHIRTLQARDIFHEALLGISQNPKVFRAVLEQQTDYIALVDAMLSIQSKKRPLLVQRPFEGREKNPPSAQEVWDTIAAWLGPNVFKGEPTALNGVQKHEQNNLLGRAVIFRFLRYLRADAEPMNKHWTTAHYINDKGLQFFDCSMEESAIYNVKVGDFVTNPKDISEKCLCCLEPHSIRFMAPKIAQNTTW